jgi:D-alanine-D-alanine ligase
MAGVAQEIAGVVVLFRDSQRLVKGDPRDLLAERSMVGCALAVEEALRAKGYTAVIVPLRGEIEDLAREYPPTEWVVFNLVDGGEGRLFEEARVAWALEAMGYCFTGARGDTLALTTHKGRTKALLAQHGIPTPPWRIFQHEDELQDDADVGLGYPVIVKPVAEDGSVGVEYPAVAHSLAEVRRRVAYIRETYCQAALVEAFIAGREFNVALWGEPPQLLPLAEIDFSAFADPCQRIVSYAAKWVEGSFEYQHTPAVFCSSLDDELRSAISSIAVAVWEIIGCQGYARVDMRVSPQGMPYVIEVNCNPDIAPDAGFFRAAAQAGMSYADMVEHIVDIALQERHLYDRASDRCRRSKYTAHHPAGRRLYRRGGPVRPGALVSVPERG